MFELGGFLGVTIRNVGDICNIDSWISVDYISQKSRIKEIIDVTCANPFSSLRRLTSYQHALWAATADEGMFNRICSEFLR